MRGRVELGWANLRSPTSDLRSLGLNGRALVERQFAWPQIAGQMKDVYDWVLLMSSWFAYSMFFAAKMRKMRKKVKFSGLLSSVFKSSV